MLLIETPQTLPAGKAADFFARLPKGMEPPLPIRLLAANPKLLDAYLPQIAYFATRETLPTHLPTCIRLSVATYTRMKPCEDFNAELLQRMGMTAEEVRGVAEASEDSHLDARELAMLRFVLRGATDPDAAGADDIRQLKEFGWTEEDILDCMVQASFMNGISTLVAALSA